MQTIIDQADYEVDLLVDEANEPAIKLYKSLGFQFAEMLRRITHYGCVCVYFWPRAL